ncbi:MAG TPA: 2-C-methyl-D-erythritol 4-phosphate cytidylyltransferase [Pseudonocardiaceae bacterium]
MSDGCVVVLVPVTGRAGMPAGDLPLLVRAVRGLIEIDVIGRIVVIAPESEMDIRTPLSECGGSVRVMPDVAAAVADLDADTRVVLVHDPRASASADLIERVVATVLADDIVVVPVLPCSDTVKRLDADGFIIDSPNRDGLRVIRTPLGYPADAIRSGALVPGAVPVGARTVPGDPA